MAKTINVGKVTAYADAVAGGYQGTREEWEAALAGIGQEATAALAAKEGAEAAQAAAEEAQGGAETAGSAAAASAQAAAASAADAHTDALAATAAKEGAEAAQTLAGQAAQAAAGSAGTAATAQVEAEAAQTAAETAASAAATSAEGAALSEDAAAASATAAAGSAEDAQEVLDSIPEDYSELSNDVTDLKSAFESLEADGIVPLSFTLESGKAIAYGTGAERSLSGKSATGYIDISRYDVLIYARSLSTASGSVQSTTAGMAFYDSSKQYISGQSQMNRQSANSYVETQIPVPANAVYARFSAFDDPTVGTFFARGVSIVNDVAKWNKSLLLTGNTSNLIEYNALISAVLDSDDGTTSYSASYLTTDFIPVKPGEILYSNIPSGRYWTYTDTKVKFRTGNWSNATALNAELNSLTIPENAAFFRTSNSASLKDTIYLCKVTPYERYLTEKDNSAGITMYCIGDSITRGMYTDIGDITAKGPTAYGYPYWVGKINNYTIVNLGESSGGYVQKGDNNLNGKDIVDNNSFDDAGIITIALGVNDWKSSNQSLQLGDMSSTSGDGTVIGNLKYMIETLCDPTSGKAKTAQVIVMLPMNENRFSQGDFSTNWGFGYAFRENKTLTDYRQAIKECADYYNVKVIDPETVCPINRYNIRNVLGDGLHPTLAFYKQMGQALAPLVH